MPIHKGSHIQQAPVTLCRLLSPFTTVAEAQSELELTLSQPLLLDKVIECANKHFMTATLFAQLNKHDLIHLLPNDLSDFLAYQHDFMLKRNQRLMVQVQSIVKLLNQQGYSPLLMKGSDTLFYDLYPTQGCRFMSDVDILMPEGSVPSARAQLIAHGYAIPEKYRDIKETALSHHAVPLYKTGDDCAVELHYHPLNHKADSLLSTLMAFTDANIISSVKLGQADALRLSATDKVMHCFAHSELCHDHQRYDFLEIRQMDYFARLLAYYGDNIDWHLLETRLAEKGHLTDFAVYCDKFRRLFKCPASIPLPTQGLINENMEKRYQSSLASTMIQYHPTLRLRYTLLKALTIFQRQQLQYQYQFPVDNVISHMKAILLKVAKLLTRLILRPKLFMQQLKSLSTH